MPDATPSASTEVELRGKLAVFAQYLLEQKGKVAAAYVISLIGVLMTLLLPWPVKFMIDSVLAGRAELPVLSGASASLQVIVLAGAILALAALTAVILGFDKLLHARIRERFSYRLREDLVERLFQLTRCRRQSEMSGELTMRLVSDTQLVSRLMCKTMPLTLKHTATALLMLLAILLINVPIGLIALTMGIVLGSIVMVFGPRISEAAADKRQQEGVVSALTQETVVGIEHVQAMGLESQARSRYLDKARVALHAGVQEIRVSIRLERTAQIVAGLALALVAGAGGIAVVSGHLTLGTLTVCLAYVTQLLKPIEKLNEIATTISRGIVRMDRLYDLLSDGAQAGAQLHGADPGPITSIELANVSYRYPDNAVDTIAGIDAGFRRGECTAIVGPSGGGKSTLLRLLLQIQKPSSGRILFNGVDSRSLDDRSIRGQFAVLLQDAHLFAGTFREILTELDPDAGETRLRRALHEVDLLALADSLPQQLDTQVDEAGTRISGGQRARLLLARALLARRPVLVLDEPFANIDADSRRIILTRLQAAKRERIVVVVTHERSSLSIADNVLRIAEFGTPSRGDTPPPSISVTALEPGYAEASN